MMQNNLVTVDGGLCWPCPSGWQLRRKWVALYHSTRGPSACLACRSSMQVGGWFPPHPQDAKGGVGCWQQAAFNACTAALQTSSIYPSSRLCSGARVYGTTTTAMHGMNPPPGGAVHYKSALQSGSYNSMMQLTFHATHPTPRGGSCLRCKQ